MLSSESLLVMYHAYVHSIMTFGIIFWGKSTNSDQIFKIQTRTVRVRFEVFTAVAMKNGVFLDVTPCGSCKNC
jgi:hypothetical protein